MAFSLGEYQDIFLEEADDQLQELNKNLLDMEQNPDDEDTINNIFRAAHSLKSSAAFVGLNDLSELAHKMENLLQGVRDKTMHITPEIIDLLFKCFDYINSVIDRVSKGEKPDIDLSEIIQEITDAQAESGEETPAVSPGISGTPVKSEDTHLEKVVFTANEKRHLKRGLDEGLVCFELAIFIEPDAPMKWVKAQLILNNLKNISQIVKTVPDEENLTDEAIRNLLRVIILTDEEITDVRSACDVDLVTRIDLLQISLERKDNKYVIRYGERETLSEIRELYADETGKADEPDGMAADGGDDTGAEPDSEIVEYSGEESGVTLQKGGRREIGAHAGSPSLRTVKVSVDKLDDLLNNVGELVIANSGFFRMYEDLKKLKLGKKIGNDFKNRIETMARIAKDLQSGIMKTRMVPIGQVFSRFHRLTRDLSKETGKSVQLITKGEDTELDKKVIDVIGEPLMHMVRNSVDHAIETIEERARLKKNETGSITLSAHQGGNQIFVEVIDDGKGLDVEQIKVKALERGLATSDQLAAMEDVEIYNFIFHPGFSTARSVTDVSGRGVGMNVVKEVVEEMGGSISIESERGMGTRFIMAFPLTLAIIPAIMVKVATETYAIPLTDVIETVNIDKKDITTIEGHEVINLRGEILSLVRLNSFVGIRSRIVNEDDIPVVVVGYSSRKIGLIVDELEGKLEIVIKSLETNYKTVEGLAGASILGDGSIALILDVASMINKVISEQERLSHEEKLELIRKQEEEFDAVEEENRQYAELTSAQEEMEEAGMDLSDYATDGESTDSIYRLKETDTESDETASLPEDERAEDVYKKGEEAVPPVTDEEPEPEKQNGYGTKAPHTDVKQPAEAAQDEQPTEAVDDASDEYDDQIDPLMDDDYEMIEDTAGHAAEDITDLKRTEELLHQAKQVSEKANEAKSEFLANMSHELRTPLNGILGLTQLVIESELDTEQQSNLRMVRESAQELLSIVNDILDVSKVEMGV
ncbi:MAG: chemotaxis protein CheW, partial [Spirochaetota bacterium]